MINDFLEFLRMGKVTNTPPIRSAMRSVFLVFALLVGIGNVWGAEGDELGICQGTGSGYGTRRTLTDTHSVGWVLSTGQNGYLGTNNATNHDKVVPTADDLPVVKAQDADATTTTTGYYFYYTSSTIANVGAIEFSHTASNSNATVAAYIVSSSTAASEGSATWTKVNLASTSTSAQGASVKDAGTYTFTFDATQTSAKYYGIILAVSGAQRLTAGTIKILEGAGDATLTSITITGTPDKVTYEAGETFDYTGLVATGHYDDSSSENLTSSVVWAYTPAGALTQGLTSVNVTATKGTIVGNKDVDITVNEHVVTPGEYSILLANAFWGTSGIGASAGHTATGTKNDITISIEGSSGTQNYINDAETRIYGSHTLTFSVPTGYVLTEITGLGTADKNDISAVSTGSISERVWTGSANSVSFTINGRTDFTTVSVTFEAEAADAPSVTVDPTAIELANPDAANGTIDVTYTNITTASVAVGLFTGADCTEAFSGDWLSASLNGDKDIEYTIAANTGAARTAYIKLTAPASNGTSPDVVKIIKVSQAKGIPVYTALDAIFDAATTSDQTIKVTFNNWVVSALKGTNTAYLTDGTYGLVIFTEAHGFNVGDVLSGTVQTTLTKFQGNAELKGLTATTEGLSVSAGGIVSERVLDAAGVAALTGANAGSLIKISGECTETSSKYYIQGVQIYNGLYSYDNPTAGDVYDCTGIFLMFNSIKEILPRQDGDLEQSTVTPTAIITLADVVLEKGQNTTLAATISPAVAASAEVTYSIVDGGEYVSLAGDILTATEVGTAHIRATVADGTGYNGNTKDITITVTAADDRYKAEQTGFNAISGKLATVTEGSHKGKEYISYEAKKGTASNAPIIPSGKNYIRIYQNGGYLAINAVKGCLIDEVILSIPSGCNSTTIAVGTDEENLPTTGGTSVTAGNNFTTGTGLNSQNVYLVCLGTTSSTRLEVGAITVRYTGDPVAVSSIAIGGDYQTEFTKNAVFDHTGVVVTATYTDESNADVTALAEFSEPDMSTLGTKEITVSYGGKSTTYEIEVVAATLEEITLSGTYPTRFNAEDAFSYEGMTVTAIYSDDSEEDVTASATFSGYDMSIGGTQTVTVAYGGKTAVYNIIVVPENTDVLTADIIGVAGTSYADWTDKTGFGTNSVYAGNSTNGTGTNAGAIQLRYDASDTKKQAGIVLTSSNGLVLKGFSVKVTSGSNTLNVYAKNTAYTSRLDLYSAEETTRGKLIGTISGTGTLTLADGVSYDDNYQYIGMRSNGGALYLSEITITWGEAATPPTPVYEEVRTGLEAGNYYTICYNKTMTAIQGASLWSFAGKDASVAYLTEEPAPFAAGKPYILYAESDKLEAVLEGDAVDASALVANGAIHGTFSDMDQAALDAAGDNIYLVIGNELRRVDDQTGNRLPAYRAYVDLDEIPGGAPAPMPGRRVRTMPMKGQVTTDIDEVTSGKVQSTKVLIDGELFILRGEKMYNASGALVK